MEPKFRVVSEFSSKSVSVDIISASADTVKEALAILKTQMERQKLQGILVTRRLVFEWGELQIMENRVYGGRFMDDSDLIHAMRG